MSENSPFIGKPAPAFTLPNQNGKNISLNDFKGKWVVLYFYPEDDTPGCTTESCEFTGNLKTFETLNAAIIGVSPDSQESHRAFIAKYNLSFPLLSDPTHTMMTAYDAYGEKNVYGNTVIGVKRSTFLIDPNGTVAWHWPRVIVEGHVSAVKEKLTELQKKK